MRWQTKPAVDGRYRATVAAASVRLTYASYLVEALHMRKDA